MRIRRYEVMETSGEVEERIMRALGQRGLASVHAQLADLYEGDLPIPPEIEQREVTFNVRNISLSHHDSLRAFGFTPENASVTISIPNDRDMKSVLSLVDTASTKPSRKRSRNHR